MVHPDKSIFKTVRSIEYLGFAINSQSMTVSLTQKKKASIKQLCHKMLQEEVLIIGKIARILRKITSGFPAVCFGPMHYRSLGRLGRDKFLALKFVEGSFEKEMEVSQAWKMDILLDASKSGWGVFFDKKTIGGHLSLDKSLLDNNVLEMKAV